MAAPARTSRTVSEAVRERETFKYGPPLLASFRRNHTGRPLPSSELCASSDGVLTALAQLGTLQTGTERALITLFDANYQYMVAEASPSQQLGAELCVDTLWLCGTAIPRAHGICEHVLYAAAPADSEPGRAGGELPLTLVSDLAADPRFSSKPYCQLGDESPRGYAAVPIRTRRGINIGVFCVLTSTPLHTWDDRSTRYLRDISDTITNYLESNRLKHSYRRSERIIRGLGSLMQGKATVSDWQPEHATPACSDTQELLTPATPADGPSPLPSEHTAPTPCSGHNPGPSVGHIAPGQANECGSESTSPSDVFSKAANIIREAFEVEGCLFFDANPASRRSAPILSPLQERRGFVYETAGQSSLTSSSDEQPLPLPFAEAQESACELLGFSTSAASSINGGALDVAKDQVPQRFLAKLLARYPNGNIFNFDAVGELQSSDSSEDDGATAFPPMAPKGDSGSDAPAPSTTRKAHAGSRFSKTREGALIHEAFPGARSVAFIPVWDSKRDRWLAGGFVYTNTPTRVLTVEGELNPLRAVALLLAAEILSLKASQADKAKADTLGSLSHELRSPLHGVILSTELLNDTNLTVFQENTTHTIETCCRTLLDTIDHLLDYSKVNSLAARQKTQEASAGSSRLKSKRVRPDPLSDKSTHARVRLDELAEEVIESVFLGFSSQHMVPKNRQEPKRAHGAFASRDRPLKQATQQLSARLEADGQKLVIGEVAVYLSIDPTCDWVFNVQGGALRRIIMNLFGNSLKYTTRGTIKISLSQQATSEKRHTKSHRLIKLVVADSGKGIGYDYLRHELFKPFAQEDEHAPGTGLGLSIVKTITSQLRGKITVESQVGIGTTITITLPLEPAGPAHEAAPSSSPEEAEVAFEEQVRDLRGLRIRLRGFGEQWSLSTGGDSLGHGHVAVQDICRGWLHMDMITEQQQAPQCVPDIVLWSEDALPESFEQSHQLARRPNVVVCRNASTAYQRFSSYETAGQAGIFEFVSQPIGPRKLAKSISLAYTRWMGLPKLALPVRTSGPGRSFSSHAAHSLSARAPTRQSGSMSDPESKARVVSTSAKLAAPPQLPVSDEPPPAGEPLSNPPVDSMEMNKVLLVDDNHINLKILSTYMKKLGRAYEMATNGREAVEAYTHNPKHYAGILMDMSMPVMDGFEATRCIRAYERKHQPCRAVAILALTGLASDSAHREALDSGVDLFLTKPVKLKALSSVMESMQILQQADGS